MSSETWFEIGRLSRLSGQGFTIVFIRRLLVVPFWPDRSPKVVRDSPLHAANWSGINRFCFFETQTGLKLANTESYVVRDWPFPEETWFGVNQ